MRIQHNISPPLPGRGGSRKRKREEPEPSAPQADTNQYGYATFKLDSNGNPDDPDDPRMDSAEYQNGMYASGSGQPRPGSPELEGDDDGEDEIPQYLLMQAEPQTGLIMGRTPTMVKYLIMKAKHQYAVEQHEALVEELRVLRKEERLWKERKDALMDELLHVYFGWVWFVPIRASETYVCATQGPSTEAHRSNRDGRPPSSFTTWTTGRRDDALKLRTTHPADVVL